VILFAFGSRLQAELDAPVGLLLGAVGGTPSGSWFIEEMDRSDAAYQAQVTECADRRNVEIGGPLHASDSTVRSRVRVKFSHVAP
jgi:hypothetical protein